MEIIRITESIVEYLILSSALLFLLGILSFLVLKALKVNGKPTLFICSLLIVLPLAYPVKGVFPDRIVVPVPHKIYQSFDFQMSDKTNFPVKEETSIQEVSINKDSEEEAGFLEHEILNGMPANRIAQKAYGFSFDWRHTVIILWCAIFLYFLIRMISIVYNMNRFIKQSAPVTDTEILSLLEQSSKDTGLKRPPVLLTAKEIAAPVVMGFIKLRILIPGHLLNPGSREGLRFTLLHELKHIHQRHNWWLLVESIIGAAYFFHPVIHWAKNRIHEEMEHVCDSHVINVTKKSALYADFLLNEVWQQNCKKNPAMALPFISGDSKTANRVRSILNYVKPNKYGHTRGQIAVGFFLLIFSSFILCSIAPYPQESEPVHNARTVTAVDQHTQTVQVKPAEIEKIVFEEHDNTAVVESLPEEAPEYVDAPIVTAVVNTKEFDEPVITKVYEEQEPVKVNIENKIEKKLPEQIEHRQAQNINNAAIIKNSIENMIAVNRASIERTRPSRDNIPETKTLKYLGTPVDRIALRRITNIRIIDEQTILFKMMRRNEYYITRLASPCPALLYTEDFKVDSLNHELTKFDRIYPVLADNIMGSNAILNDFYPFKYEGSYGEAVKVLKKGLLKELAAEGAFQAVSDA